MEHGIALPHLATDRVDEVICAVGTAPNGIPFGSLDGKLTKVVVLLLLPRKNFEGEVLALAGVQHLLKNQAIVTNLLKATNSVDACRLIEEAENPA
jgi:mannitol/fructose-specific phosphotransferase system IIA component (Ntr-type)